MTRLSAIDIFAGAGGLSLGLHQAGFEVLFANDIDPAAARTYSCNFPGRVELGDIADLGANDVLRIAGLSAGECDLLVGGPPCQGFSVQRRGPDEDARSLLILDYLRLLEGIRPRLFLMENVGGLLSKRGLHLIELLRNRAELIGYVTQVAKVDAVRFGVPQFRERVLLVGHRRRGAEPIFEFPTATHSRNRWRTVRDAIGDLPSPPEDGSCHPKTPNHYREKRLSTLNLERLRHIPPGGGRENLPLHLQLPCHVNNPSHRHVDVYGRLAWDRPAGTITARFDSFTRGRFAHPEQDRSITLREGARLQTFPDWFVFEGNREEGARQIGNAVPPLLAERLAQAARISLEGTALNQADSAAAVAQYRPPAVATRVH